MIELHHPRYVNDTLHEREYEYVSGSMFTDLDTVLDSDEDFDPSFVPHIWWGPFWNLNFKVEGIERYRDYTEIWGTLTFEWDRWKFQLEAIFHDLIHECPYCECAKGADLETALRNQLEML